MIAKEPRNYFLKSTKKGCTFRTFPFGLHGIHCGKVITTGAYPRCWFLQESQSTSKNPTHDRIEAGHQFRASHENLQATSSIQYEVLPLHILKIFTETHRKRSYSVYVWFILLSSSVGKNPHIRLLGSTAKQHNKKVTAVSAVATFSWQGRFRCHQKDQRPVLHPLIDAICPRTKSHNLCNF